MQIFSGTSNRPLAEKIAEYFALPLSELEIFTFPDGERRVKVQGSVVAEECIIVQATSTPVDHNYMELFFIADSLKRSGARSVTAVIPYLGYQRQDHVFRDGEAVSLEVVIKIIESLGIDRVIALDLHSIKIPEMFHIPLIHLPALPLFAEIIKKQGWDNDDSVLVTPDMGGIRRIKIISELLGNMPYITIEKNRDLDTGQIQVSHFAGKVKKRVLIVDDMISSGKTMVEAAKLLKAEGAEECIIFATHPVFSADAPRLLQESVIDRVFVTDSVTVPEEKYFPKLTVVTIAEMVAKAIQES